LAPRLSLPRGAATACGYAELVSAQTHPTCDLCWTTWAGIGLGESDHGRAQGATLTADGMALPPIIGQPLDGLDGRKRVADTDGGRLDGDRVWDRAVGPMQFIPATWAQYAVDADGNGVSDPNDIDDAALAAASYLCGDGRDLGSGYGWWAAVLSYNNVQEYADRVIAAEKDYSLRSQA